jgi:UDPglucose 6-dehydrogenase
MSRIFIVGSGQLGAATGRTLAHAGHQVTFIDTAERRLAGLRAEGWDARPELSLAGEPDSFVFLAHPTTSHPRPGRPPMAGSGGSSRRRERELARDRRPGYDLSALNAGVEQVARALVDAESRPIVVVRSSVPPGTTQDLVGWQLERICGRREGEAFGLAVSPELGPGPGHPADEASGRDGAPSRRMTVVGSRDPLVVAALRDLLAPLGGRFRSFGAPAAAELVKCTHSALHATRISFWNEIWQICDRLGLDQDAIADAVAGVPEPAAALPHGGHHHAPARPFGSRGGAPYGGERLPRDLGGLLDLAGELDLPVPLMTAVVEVNDFFEERMALELDHLDVLAALPRGVGLRPPLPGDPAEPDEAWHPLAGRHRAPRVPRQYGH